MALTPRLLSIKAPSLPSDRHTIIRNHHQTTGTSSGTVINHHRHPKQSFCYEGGLKSSLFLNEPNLCPSSKMGTILRLRPDIGHRTRELFLCRAQELFLWAIQEPSMSPILMKRVFSIWREIAAPLNNEIRLIITDAKSFVSKLMKWSQGHCGHFGMGGLNLR